MNKVLFWFRNDLRLSDNPGLYNAVKNGSVLPIYIIDTTVPDKYKPGAATNWWLHHSLASLNKNLDNKLCFYTGDPLAIIPYLINQHNITAVYWNRCYEPHRIKKDTELKKILVSNEIEVESYNGSLLWEPWRVLKSDGTPYKVFTPFYRKGCLASEQPRATYTKPRNLKLYKDVKSKKYQRNLSELNLLPKINWDEEMASTWSIGEAAAHNALKKFLKSGISNYKEGRNFPAKKNVSRLSPHLHFGEISPNQVWYAALESELVKSDNNLDTFLSELGWREFSYYLLYHFPNLPQKNFQAKFDAFPWVKSTKLLKAWQKGQTGYPIVDAGMRELWRTGYMHNRVRMIVGSFLVKNLLLHWHHGEAWFWDCLVDADLASNSASWQWVAGSGADAAPYFRIFNPVTQGEKFDPDGGYTLKYVPELANLNKKYLYKPWDAPTEELERAGVVLGKDYPEPIIDLKESREKALAAFAKLKSTK